jgi:hypothetical protein
MHWREIPKTMMIVVHTAEPPTDVDWDAYLGAVERAGDIRGILVYSLSVGPTSSQRARSVEATKKSSRPLKMAIMTGSRLTQGVVTALSWALGNNIRAFSSRDFDKAIEYLELSTEERVTAKVVLKQLARMAGTVVDAFADESGQFRQKYER